MVSEKEKPDSKASPFLTKQEVADDARKSIAWVDDLIASGQLLITKWAPGKTGGVGIKKTDWAAFKESREVPAVPDITGKLAELAKSLSPAANGLDWRDPRNVDFLNTYSNALAAYRYIKAESERSRAIFWDPKLWKSIVTIEINLSVLLDFSQNYDDEVFTAGFLGRLISKQLNLWASLIKSRLDKMDGLNPALVADALPAGMGLWMRTREPGREQRIHISAADYTGVDPDGENRTFKIMNILRSIPAPTCKMAEKELFIHRDFELKIAKAGTPSSVVEDRHRDAENVAKQQADIEKLVAETEGM